MKVDLSQEYKDNLYEKVLEKKKQRTKTRKVLLNTFLVFVSVVGIASYGFSKLSKGDYNNFFVSKTDNIEFNDEYEYFDDLGIKLEFINKDENSLTIGINIKYDNIKDFETFVKYVNIVDNDTMEKIVELNMYDDKKIYVENYDMIYQSNDNMIYFLTYTFQNKLKIKNICVEINEVVLVDRKNDVLNKVINWKKEISIE